MSAAAYATSTYLLSNIKTVKSPQSTLARGQSTIGTVKSMYYGCFLILKIFWRERCIPRHSWNGICMLYTSGLSITGVVATLFCLCIITSIVWDQCIANGLTKTKRSGMLGNLNNIPKITPESQNSTKNYGSLI